MKNPDLAVDHQLSSERSKLAAENHQRWNLSKPQGDLACWKHSWHRFSALGDGQFTLNPFTASWPIMKP